MRVVAHLDDIEISQAFEIIIYYWSVCLLLLSGRLLFWKKRLIGIEFAKHFRSHLSPIEGLAISSLTWHNPLDCSSKILYDVIDSCFKEFSLLIPMYA